MTWMPTWLKPPGQVETLNTSLAMGGRAGCQIRLTRQVWFSRKEARLGSRLAWFIHVCMHMG